MIREINSSVEAWLVNFQGFPDAGQLAVVSYPTLGEGRLDKWLGAGVWTCSKRQCYGEEPGWN